MTNEQSLTATERDLIVGRVRSQVPPMDGLSVAQLQQLVEELQFQKIELEVQNHQLKQAERGLQQSQRMLQLIVEHSPAAVAVFDREMCYLAASRRYAIDFDLGPVNLIGRSHYEVFPEVPEHWKAIHRRCLAGAVERCDEEAFPRADGRMDWVRWEIQPWRESAEQVEGLVLFVEVITDRKQAELDLRTTQERFTTVFRDAPVSMAITDLTSRTYLDVNKYALRAAGFTREEVIGRTVSEVGWLTPAEQQRFLQEIAEHGCIRGMEMEFRTKLGETLYGWVTGRQITIQGRLHLLTVAADITERKVAENIIANQLGELQRWQNVTLGREDRVLELKREVNELLKRSGKPLRYGSVK